MIVNKSTFETDVKNGIRIVMVNGGFVPEAKTLLKNEKVYVPLNKFAKILGVEFEYNSQNLKLTIKNNDTTVLIPNIGNMKVIINGNEFLMPDKLELVGNEFYVPLRFIAEAFGGTVQYIDNYMSFMDKDVYENLPDIHIISIEINEKTDNEYTINDGLEKITLLSLEKYNQIGNKANYDPTDVVYTGKCIGRFYVYELKGFETMPVFFNKYTGEVYSEKSGLPFLLIEKGFPNINFIL